MNELTDKIALQLLKQWRETKDKLEKISKEESELRSRLANHILDGKTDGSKTSYIDDVKVRATAPMYYTVDKSEYELYKEDFSDDDWKALEFKPSIKSAIFKKLPVDSMLRQVTKATPGKKQFAIVESKV